MESFARVSAASLRIRGESWAAGLTSSFLTPLEASSSSSLRREEVDVLSFSPCSDDSSFSASVFPKTRISARPRHLSRQCIAAISSGTSCA